MSRDYSTFPKLLTIAGSDSAGCAGIQADLKTFAALGCHGMSVLTSVTAQNTLGVSGIYDVSPEMVEKQIDAVLSDVGADAVKTGMLSQRPIVESVARKLRHYRVERLVVDPVLAASSGDLLLSHDAVDSLRTALIPLARVLTPNLREAEVLADMKIQSIQDMEHAARKIAGLGAAGVLVKGGHLEGDAVDIYFDGKRALRFSTPRLPNANAHGAGCTLASAIAVFLARGLQPDVACQKAKQFVTEALRHAFQIGKGRGPLAHFYKFWQ